MDSSETLEYPWLGDNPQSAEGFVCLPAEVRARLEKRTLESIAPNEIRIVNFSSIVIDRSVDGAMMVDARDTLPKKEMMDNFDPRYNPIIMRIFTEEADGYLVDYRYITEMKKASRLSDGTVDSAEYKNANEKYGAEPALGFIVLGDDGAVIMKFVDGYDFTDEANYLIEQVDTMIPELLVASHERERRDNRHEHELALAAQHLVQFTRQSVVPAMKNFFSFISV